ncbi:MAG: hypothetical protein H6710_04830 [Myxococcales bacterium]|nr:hypothetical protein [Myxococcales bacterium]
MRSALAIAATLTGALWAGGPLACAPKLAAGPDAADALAKRPALPDYNLRRESLAIQGYDPVAYFPEGGGAPLAGDPTITATYEGVVYRFASAEHRDRFVASPRRYEPAYGGWCAYAMAKGNRINVNPEAFLIQDERLLLFYRTALADTREKWQERPGDMLLDADINWRNQSGECPNTRRAGAPMSRVDGESASGGGGEGDAADGDEASTTADAGTPGDASEANETAAAAEEASTP